MKSSIYLGVILSAILSFGANAATFDVVGGQLMGVSGIDVGGTWYDIQFIDGTCTEIFEGCDETSDFTFNNSTPAQAAASALLNLLSPSFVGDAPELINGCTADESCLVFTPFRATSVGSLNWMTRIFDSLNDGVLGRIGIDRADDFSLSSNFVYGVWSVSPVPVPAAAWLFGSALLGLVGISRKRKQQA